MTVLEGHLREMTTLQDQMSDLAVKLADELKRLEAERLLDSKPSCHFCKEHYLFPGEMQSCRIENQHGYTGGNVCHVCLKAAGLEPPFDRNVRVDLHRLRVADIMAHLRIERESAEAIARRDSHRSRMRAGSGTQPAATPDPIAVALDQIEADPPFEATGARRPGTAYEHGPPIEQTTLTQEREGIRLRSFRDDQQSRRKAAAQTVSHVLVCPYNRTELLTRLRKCDLCPNWCFGKYCDDCVSKYAEKPSQQCADCREVFHLSKMVELLFSGNCQGFVCEKCAAPDGSPARTIERLEERWAKEAHDKAAKTAD